MKISNKLGNTFPTLIVFFGFILTVFGLLYSIKNPLYGLIMFLIGFFTCTFNYGVQVVKEKDIYREYSSIFFIKFGKWKSLNGFDTLSILKKKESMRVYGPSTQSTINTEIIFAVCLIKNKYSHIDLMTFKKESDAQVYYEKIKNQLGI